MPLTYQDTKFQNFLKEKKGVTLQTNRYYNSYIEPSKSNLINMDIPICMYLYKYCIGAKLGGADGASAPPLFLPSQGIYALN